MIARSPLQPDAGDPKDRLRRLALASGFDAIGFCRSEVLQPERERYLKWLGQGRQGDMRWITGDWVETATDPGGVLPGARSVLCVALSYSGRPARRTPSGTGRIARYAMGTDYHSVLRDRLEVLCKEIGALGASARPFVDTAPTMDKALAVRAGIGWQGRNTNVLSRALGSFTFLGGVITDLQIEPDVPAHDGCGSCRLCVVACPTGALKGDYTIDARLCISYLTIEHRGPIPRHLRSQIGDWVFGCDICQDVCPPVTAIQDRQFPREHPAAIAYRRSAVLQSNGKRREVGEEREVG